jgi:hypothetical protein
MSTDPAAERYPPLPAPFKTRARDVRTPTEDAEVPAKAAVPDELGEQLGELTRAIGELRDELRRWRAASADRAAAPTFARALPARRSAAARILWGVARLTLALALAAAAAAALMLFVAAPAGG